MINGLLSCTSGRVMGKRLSNVNLVLDSLRHPSSLAHAISSEHPLREMVTKSGAAGFYHEQITLCNSKCLMRQE